MVADLKSDVLVILAIVLFPITLLFLSFYYVDSGLIFILLSASILFVGYGAVCRQSIPDLIFIFVINYGVGLQVVSLFIWPEFLAYQEGVFAVVMATADAVERSLFLLVALNLGWGVVLIFDRCATDVSAIKGNSGDNDLSFFVKWFFLSVVALALGAVLLAVGVAGVESEFQYSGFLYYLFPADYLVLVLCVGLGLGQEDFKRREIFIWSLIVVYLGVKILSGWKSPLLNIFLAYMVGAYYRGGSGAIFRLIPLGVFVAMCYLFLVKPIVDFVRVGEWFAGVYMEELSGINPFAGRLTEGTLFGIATIESGYGLGMIDMRDFLGDFVNRLVPGTIWDIKSIDRVFTEDVLGQQEGVASTFAPGLLGMAEMLGGIGAAFLYGIFFRFLVFFLMHWINKSQFVIVKFYLLGVVPIFIVSFCIDGYFGGFERAAVIGIVLTFVLWGRSFVYQYLGSSKSPV